MQIARATFDPLDAVDVTLRVINASSAANVTRFGQTSEYAIALLDGTRTVWTSPARGGGRPHARTFAPGATTLLTYEWNGVLADGTAPTPGTYVVTGTLLANGARIDTRAKLRIAAPLPISALAKTGTQVVTIAGTLDATGMTLHDASGDVRLARRIAGASSGATVDVRGSIATQPDGTSAFVIERWAPVHR